jgi:nucleotide-binding universal stress UspA family protein
MPQFAERRRRSSSAYHEAVMAGTRPQRLVDSVVVGFDGSDASRRAVARATAAVEPGGKVVLVTASRLPEEEEMAASDSRAPDELLDEAAALCRGRDVQVVRHVAHAEPAEALVGVARDVGADLIVVGARGDSFVARALRGSVGEKLVARAPCDVLVVR